jgi:aspartate aminotransferase
MPELKALTDVLVKHPACLGADRRHVRASRLRRLSSSPRSAQVEPKLYDRTLTMNGVSKAYCMTGWRIGYGAARDLIKAMAKLQSQSTSNPSSIAQWAAGRSAERPAGFHSGTTRCSRSAAISWCRC